jgi:hypothetical protein
MCFLLFVNGEFIVHHVLMSFFNEFLRKISFGKMQIVTTNEPKHNMTAKCFCGQSYKKLKKHL